MKFDWDFVITELMAFLILAIQITCLIWLSDILAVRFALPTMPIRVLVILFSVKQHGYIY